MRKEHYTGQFDDEISYLEQLKRELQESLAALITPDYQPSENPDDEYRDRDIEELENEIRDINKEIRSIKRAQHGVQSDPPPAAAEVNQSSVKAAGG